MAKLARLICCGSKFEVPMTVLILLEPFNEDPSLLSKPYSVSSNVSLDVFQTFVDALTGKDVDVTLDNYAELALLRKEFGFKGLDEKIGEAKKEDEKDNGVIRHLTRITGGNPADKGLVDVTSSSLIVMFEPEHALDLDDNESYYLSSSEPDAWICLDFKARKVSVTRYSLCSGFLKSWVIEGSHDGSVWDQLDKKDDNEDMKEKPYEASFDVFRHGEYRFIRLTQTGDTHYGCDNLHLSKIDLFGTLIEGPLCHLLTEDRRSVRFPDDCLNVPDFAFAGCTSLEIVEFGSASQLMSIGKEAFAHTSIKNIMIPAKCKRIDPLAFVGCNIETVSVQAGNTSFRGHSCLLLSAAGKQIIVSCGKSVTVPPTIEEIDRMTFVVCSEVESFLVPMHVRNVADDSFSGCKQLKSLVFENPAFRFRYFGAKFQGIIAHLARMCGGNVVDEGAVDATGSSVFSGIAYDDDDGDDDNDMWKPRNALDLDNNNWYLSEKEPEEWFCLDFKARKVSVTHYSLCSRFLKSWVLEGSHDGSAWEQLDERDNNEDMQKETLEASFVVFRQGEYRFIRLRRTEASDSDGDWYGGLRLGKVELFGALIE